MSDADLKVTFGADTSGMTAALAQAKAQLSAFATQVEANSKSAATGMSAMTRAMSESTMASGAMVRGMSQINTAAAEVAKGVEKVGHSAHEGATGLAWFSAHASETFREVHAMGDELSSGRIHQFMGSFSKLFFDFAAANPIIATVAGGLLALTGVLIGVARYQEEAALSAAKLEEAELAVGKATDFSAAYDQITNFATAMRLSRDQAEE